MVDVAKVNLYGQTMGYAYNPQGSWTSTHQMSVNGKFYGITRQDLMACALRNNIKNAPEIIDQVCIEVSRWPKIARECGVPQTMVDSIYPNIQLV